MATDTKHVECPVCEEGEIEVEVEFSPAEYEGGYCTTPEGWYTWVGECDNGCKLSKRELEVVEETAVANARDEAEGWRDAYADYLYDRWRDEGY